MQCDNCSFLRKSIDVVCKNVYNKFNKSTTYTPIWNRRFFRMKKKTPFPNVPKGFDLIALYGRNMGYADKSEDCRIYHLNNETGAGTITIYHVFQGVRSTFNDIHMEYCNQAQACTPIWQRLGCIEAVWCWGICLLAGIGHFCGLFWRRYQQLHQPVLHRKPFWITEAIRCSFAWLEFDSSCKGTFLFLQFQSW